MTRSASQPKPDSSDPITIIRYPNRRFYDRTQSKYVTLVEIEEMVRQGKTIQVINSKGGEDITRSVLTQIILDQHPERMDLFPIPMLHLMIRANDFALASLGNYLNQSLNLINLMPTPSLNPLTASSQWMKAFFPDNPTSAEAESGSKLAENETLTKRVEELEQRLKQMLQQKEEPLATEEESLKKKESKKKQAKK